MRSWALVLPLVSIGCGSPDHRSTGEPASAAPETQVRAPPSAKAGGAGAAGADRVSPCLVQDGERIADNALHAIGTEPFWAADVEGRCVTYSTPEDQDGTRVWTRFEGTAETGRWTGALGGQDFVMATKPEQGCSDGMSDNRYPIAVTLVVRGERRSGCAEPRQDWISRQRLPDRP